MKKLLIILSFMLLSATLFAQTSNIPVIIDIVTIERDGGVNLQILNAPKGDENNYYLNLGTMGVGDKIFSVNVNPVSVLYIPLGNNLTDAIAKLQEIKDLFSMEKGESTEIQGCYSLFPKDEYQTITVTRYKLSLGKTLQFSIPKEDYIIVTYASKSDISSLLSSLKFHKKLHPNK